MGGGGVAEPFSEDRGGGFSYFRKEEKMREAGGEDGGRERRGGRRTVELPCSPLGRRFGNKLNYLSKKFVSIEIKKSNQSAAFLPLMPALLTPHTLHTDPGSNPTTRHTDTHGSTQPRPPITPTSLAHVAKHHTELDPCSNPTAHYIQLHISYYTDSCSNPTSCITDS